MITLGIVGLPFQNIYGNPLDTLIGIRVRTWALYTQLEKYGFNCYLYVDPEAVVDGEIIEKWGSNFIRSKSEFIDKVKSGKFEYILITATKLEYLLASQPWLSQIRGAKILGVFCYDNNSFIDNNILKQMIGTTFTTPMQKWNWDSRKLDVPSFLITTGQSTHIHENEIEKYDVLFIGEIRSIRVVKLLAQIAHSCNFLNFTVVTQRIIEQSNSNYQYMDFTNYSNEERHSYFKGLVESLGLIYPNNLHYQYIPHGDEPKIFHQSLIGLDFSWNDHQTIENSKVSRYLTYGLIPIVESPAPSYRYLHLFDVGEVLKYSAPPEDWARAIQKFLRSNNIDRVKLREEAARYFDWSKVAFEVASIITGQYPITGSNSKKIQNLLITNHSIIKTILTKLKIHLIIRSILTVFRQNRFSIKFIYHILIGEIPHDFGDFMMYMKHREFDVKFLSNQQGSSPLVAEWLKSNLLSGDVVIGYGSNSGYLSFISRSKVGQKGLVYAIAPTKNGYKRVKDNIQINNYQNVFAKHLKFGNHGTHYDNRESIDLVTLDEFVRDHNMDKLNFIIIEGEELKGSIIAESLKVIKLFRPKFIVSFKNSEFLYDNLDINTYLDSVIDVIFSFGYLAFAEEGIKLTTKQEFFELLRTKSVKQLFTNILFLPKN